MSSDAIRKNCTQYVGTWEYSVWLQIYFTVEKTFIHVYIDINSDSERVILTFIPFCTQYLENVKILISSIKNTKICKKIKLLPILYIFLVLWLKSWLALYLILALF